MSLSTIAMPIGCCFTRHVPPRAAGQAPEREGDRWFRTTHWSVVLEAGSDQESAAQGALEQLCQNYWSPVNAYFRRYGHAPAEADDFTQQFFLTFIQNKSYLRADRERGRFRTFLLTAAKNFMFSEHRRARASKRGGGASIISLDGQADEPGVEIADERNAAHAYERSWALRVMAQAHARLEQEYAAEGRAERFHQLEKLFPGQEQGLTYAALATQLGVAEGTIKSDMHRLKRRYAEFLREEVAHTVSTAGEIEEELRYLLSVLSMPAAE